MPKISNHVRNVVYTICNNKVLFLALAAGATASFYFGGFKRAAQETTCPNASTVRDAMRVLGKRKEMIESSRPKQEKVPILQDVPSP